MLTSSSNRVLRAGLYCMPLLPSTMIQVNCELRPVKRCCVNIFRHFGEAVTVMLLISRGMVALWQLSYEIRIKQLSIVIDSPLFTLRTV
jgi:hypothetical protein